MFSEKLTELEKEREETGIDELIVKLDHIAYRVRMGEREKFMGDLIKMLPYHQHKSFKVISQKAITSAIKLHETFPVIVVSEGLTEDSIVEKYCIKYGSRVHHLAYEVNNIEKVVAILKERGVVFTTEEIIGSEEDGIKQIFTKPLDGTNHIIEYIQRFGGFEGFFTPSNIGDLMKSTKDLSE